MTAIPQPQPKPKNIEDAAYYFQDAIIEFQTGTGTDEEKIKRLTEASVHFTTLVGKATGKGKLRAANDNRPAKPFPGILTSGAFVADFVPPDFLIEGITQLRFIYSLTGMTGAGKTAVLLLLAYCVATGAPFCGLEVKQGRVVYSAGENPDDVKMRWIAMAEALGFDVDGIDVHFVPGTYSIPESIEKIREEISGIGEVAMIVIDTSAAFFQGDDENANTQAGNHARDMRDLTDMPGGPCVITATHPVKNASADNLLPRGGGAFLNEVDGNLTLAKTGNGSRLHWQGKHRGADFDPLMFDLQTATAERLVDSKGRSIKTVMAKALTANEVRQAAQASRRDEDDVLLQIERDGSQSLSDMAEALGWRGDEDKPDKRRESYASEKLKKDKLVTHAARKWKLTPSGQDAATEVRTERHRAGNVAAFAARMAGRNADE